MDTRGIEVTNQLRSAIRAKLMELGVRYDEELPDYILVMVVNKKSRQQMHEDLNLFLEDCTTVFVDWLHDQVLKKLQKVTVAKKRSSREFVPTVVVKQEEERKKRKNATSFLDDHTVDQSAEKSASKNVKDDKVVQKQQMLKSSNPNLEQNHNKSIEKNTKSIVYSKSKIDEASHIIDHQEPPSSKKSQQQQQEQSLVYEDSTMVAPENSATKTGDLQRDSKISEVPNKSLMKRSLEVSSNSSHDSTEKKNHEAKRSKLSEGEREDVSSSDMAKKLKSCVNKPRITSVVSVKNRLGLTSSRKKFEIYREKTMVENNTRYRQSEKRFDKHHYDNSRSSGGGGGGFQRNRNFEMDDRSRRNRDNGGSGDSRHHESVNKVNDVRGRIESNKNERLERRNAEIRESRANISSTKVVDTTKKPSCNIKDRLGVATSINKVQQQSTKPQETVEYRNSRCTEQMRDIYSNGKNVKNRLGPLKNNFRPIYKINERQTRNKEDDDCLNLNVGKEEAEKEEEEDELDNNDQPATNAGPVKSRIVAVNRLTAATRLERKRKKSSEINATQHSGYPGCSVKSQLVKTEKDNDVDEDVDDTRLPSKVIVTPRPLKPLQPTQKRATQSLLLRAVAEANQSVVTQKNPEPSLLDKKPVLKRLKPAPTRDVSQNLSVHLNSSKRLVMEKIQIELNTADNLDAEDVEPAPYVPQPVMDEHMGVVMSLFQRSDDSQKFLVTLNGYNNNPMKEKIGSEDDEEMEIEVNEDDELALLSTHNETYTPTQSELETNEFRIMDQADDNSPKLTSEKNNENCNTENVDKIDEMPRKRRKLSPIIYNRSHSPGPTQLKSRALLLPKPATELVDEKSTVENTVPQILEKSRDNCRYWPNCTLGNKCAYFHPPMCSAFPACKFGDKCAYKHPKCKFGLSCTKLSCVFSHPAQQCKYHPFCTKPTCPYSHPVASHASPLKKEATSQRAKFTWRRQE